MDILTIVGSLILCYVAYIIYQFYKSKAEFDKHGIPCKGAYPLIGHMGPAVARLKVPFEVIKDIYNMCPEAKYVGAFDFQQPIFVIQDPELIKSITIKNSDSFVDHRNIVDEKIDPLFGRNLFSLKGEKWHHVRSLLSPAFTSSKMKYMFDVMAECAKHFSKSMLEMAKDGKDIEMKDSFTRYGNDVIATCAFGLKIDSISDPKNEFYVLGRKATNFEGILSLKFFLSRSFPRLTSLLKISLFDEYLTNFFKSIIANTIKSRDENKITRPDMLQLMMEARGKSSELSLMDMTAQAFIFFFGGTFYFLIMKITRKSG